MTKIPIPPAALEAGARALCKEARLFWPDLHGPEHDIMRAEARAAFLAIVEGWPGMLTDTLVLERDNWGGTLRSETALVLPLTENPDDKA